MPLPTRIGRLRPPVLCFVIGPSALKGGELENVVTEALAGGVTMVTLSEPNMPAGELLNLARRLKLLTRGKALLVVSDRVDVAEAVEADGVHLPEDGLPTITGRAIIGKYAVLGRSVSSVEAANQASREGSEFVIAGSMYKSPTEPEAKTVGASLITEITKDSSLPVLGAGGVTADKVSEIIQAGAAGVAVTSAIAQAKDPKAAAEELSKALKEAWAARASAVAAGT